MECDAFRDDMLDVLYGEADAAAARRREEHQARLRRVPRASWPALRRAAPRPRAWLLPARVGAARPRPLLPSRAAWRRPRPCSLAVSAAALGAVAGPSCATTKGSVAFRLGRRRAGRSASPARRAAALRTRRGTSRRCAALATQLARAARRRRRGLLRRGRARSIARERGAPGARCSARAWTAARARRAPAPYDLAQVSAGLSYLDGKTGLQAARTTELMGHVLQASQKEVMAVRGGRARPLLAAAIARPRSPPRPRPAQRRCATDLERFGCRARHARSAQVEPAGRVGAAPRGAARVLPACRVRRDVRAVAARAAVRRSAELAAERDAARDARRRAVLERSLPSRARRTCASRSSRTPRAMRADRDRACGCARRRGRRAAGSARAVRRGPGRARRTARRSRRT